ncbi:putative Glycerophosphoryl diester phosphodiesterase, partial [Zostera marina]
MRVMRRTAFSSRPKFGWISLHKTIHRLVPLFIIFAVIIPIVLHFRLRRFQQMRLRGCEWLQKPPLVCAHGGDPSNAFPNTMEAYDYALRLHVDCIEIDISRSSDGVLFAIHDRELQKITGNDTAKLGYLSRTE